MLSSPCFGYEEIASVLTIAEYDDVLRRVKRWIKHYSREHSRETSHGETYYNNLIMLLKGAAIGKV